MILRRIEYPDELEAWRQLCLTSMHSGSALESFETILSFKTSGRQDDGAQAGRFELLDDDERVSNFAETADDIEIANLVRSLPPALRGSKSRRVMRNMTTRQTIPLNVRHHESDGNEPNTNLDWCESGTKQNKRQTHGQRRNSRERTQTKDKDKSERQSKTMKL